MTDDADTPIPGEEAAWPEDAATIADEAGLGYLGGQELPGAARLPDEFWETAAEMSELRGRVEALEIGSIRHWILLAVLGAIVISMLMR